MSEPPRTDHHPGGAPSAPSLSEAEVARLHERRPRAAGRRPRRAGVPAAAAGAGAAARARARARRAARTAGLLATAPASFAAAGPHGRPRRRGRRRPGGRRPPAAAPDDAAAALLADALPEVAAVGRAARAPWPSRPAALAAAAAKHGARAGPDLPAPPKGRPRPPWAPLRRRPTAARRVARAPARTAARRLWPRLVPGWRVGLALPPAATTRRLPTPGRADSRRGSRAHHAAALAAWPRCSSPRRGAVPATWPAPRLAGPGLGLGAAAVRFHIARRPARAPRRPAHRGRRAGHGQRRTSGWPAPTDRLGALGATASGRRPHGRRRHAARRPLLLGPGTRARRRAVPERGASPPASRWTTRPSPSRPSRRWASAATPEPAPHAPPHERRVAAASVRPQRLRGLGSATAARAPPRRPAALADEVWLGHEVPPLDAEARDASAYHRERKAVLIVTST